VAFAPGEIQALANYWEGWSPVKVTVRTAAGTVEGAQNFLSKMTDDEIVAKFHENVGGLRTAKRQIAWFMRCLPMNGASRRVK
jgi:hypothetical protein